MLRRYEATFGAPALQHVYYEDKAIAALHSGQRRAWKTRLFKGSSMHLYIVRHGECARFELANGATSHLQLVPPHKREA
jgi:hypothetical protein